MTHKKLTIAEAIETLKSQEVTSQFAIDYLLDDCEDCPENKDGECVTESHCFEVKQMCIKALRREQMICDECLKAKRDKCEKDISLKPKIECWIAYLEKIKTEIQEMGNDNSSYYYTCDIFEREKLLNLLDEYIEELKGETVMSDAKLCDRCGQTIKLFDDELAYKEEAWRYEITKDCHPYPEKIKIDLCSDCKKDLIRWLKR